MTLLISSVMANGTGPAGGAGGAGPRQTLSDYVEIAMYTLLILAGIPLNLLTLVRVRRRYLVTRARIFLLQLNLNVSDLLILVFHAFYRVCWLITYQWYGGAPLCRSMKFLNNLGVAFSSNVIVCIGLDRLWSLNPTLTVSGRLRRVHWALGAGWSAAVAISLPHFLIWETKWMKVTSSEQLGGFRQCVSVFKGQRLPDVFPNTSAEAYNQWLATLEFSWSLINILVNFWIPAVLISVCYALILRQVYDKLGSDGKDVQVIQYPTGAGTVTKQRRGSGGGESERSHSSTSSSRHSHHLRHPRPPANGALLPRDSAQAQRKSSSLKRMGPASLTYTTTNHTHSPHNVAQYPPHYDEENTARLLRIRRRKYKTLLTTILLVFAYVFCWLPYNSLMIWQISAVASYKRYEDRLYFLYGLIVLNSVLNPLIYGHFGAKSRRNFSLFCCRMRIVRNDQ